VMILLMIIYGKKPKYVQLASGSLATVHIAVGHLHMFEVVDALFSVRVTDAAPAGTRLQNFEFFGALNGCSTIAYIEFCVDFLGMGA